MGTRCSNVSCKRNRPIAKREYNHMTMHKWACVCVCARAPSHTFASVPMLCVGGGRGGGLVWVGGLLQTHTHTHEKQSQLPQTTKRGNLGQQSLPEALPRRLSKVNQFWQSHRPWSLRVDLPRHPSIALLHFMQWVRCLCVQVWNIAFVSVRARAYVMGMHVDRRCALL